MNPQQPTRFDQDSAREPMDDMERAYRRDYATEWLLSDADRALETLLKCPDADFRLESADREAIVSVRMMLQERRAQIVRAWN